MMIRSFPKDLVEVRFSRSETFFHDFLFLF